MGNPVFTPEQEERIRHIVTTLILEVGLMLTGDYTGLSDDLDEPSSRSSAPLPDQSVT